MLHAPEIVELSPGDRPLPRCPSRLDPVMVATSGDVLIRTGVDGPRWCAELLPACRADHAESRRGRPAHRQATRLDRRHGRRGAGPARAGRARGSGQGAGISGRDSNRPPAHRERREDLDEGAASRARTRTATAARCRAPSHRTWRSANRSSKPSPRCLYVRRSACNGGAQVRTGNCGGPLNHSHAPVAMHLRPLQHA